MVRSVHEQGLIRIFKINDSDLCVLGSGSSCTFRRNLPVFGKWVLTPSQFMGSLFIYGSIKIYVESYLRLKNNNAAESSLLFLAIPLQVVMMALFLPVGVEMNHRISVKM